MTDKELDFTVFCIENIAERLGKNGVEIYELLIPKIDTIAQNEIIKQVDLLLQLNIELQAATLPEKTEQIKSRIEYCEEKIDELVYALYGLTEEEIGILEK